jgi:hypothetical protein
VPSRVVLVHQGSECFASVIGQFFGSSGAHNNKKEQEKGRKEMEKKEKGILSLELEKEMKKGKEKDGLPKTSPESM